MRRLPAHCDGKEPLDASSVHPEAYGVAKKIVAACGRDLRSLMGDSAALKALDPRQFRRRAFGLPTVATSWRRAGKARPRPAPGFKTATFAEGINEIKDLKPGMMLEGTVTNVAAFGAFVDIGVHQDGLVHVSQLADRFVKDAHEVVKAGDVVKVRVVEVDASASASRFPCARTTARRAGAAWRKPRQSSSLAPNERRTSAPESRKRRGRSARRLRRP
jgi:uncharacterized protein